MSTIINISIGQMILDWATLTATSDTTAANKEQDQNARICRLILIYTLRKISPCWAKDKMAANFYKVKNALSISIAQILMNDLFYFTI